MPETREKDVLRGKLLVDLINAETTHEAMKGLMDNIQALIDPQWISSRPLKYQGNKHKNTSDEIIAPFIPCPPDDNTPRTIGEHELGLILSNPELVNNPVLAEHVCLEVIRRNLRCLFSELTRGTNLSEIEAASFFESLYNAKPIPWAEIQENGSIFREVVLEEEHILSAQEFSGTEIDFITFCLINFLENQRNRQLSHKCKRCEKFFVSKRVNPRTRYCPACSPKSRMKPEERREYMRKYRVKKKEEKERKLAPIKKEYIENLLRQGIPKEEAEKEWDQHRRETRL